MTDRERNHFLEILAANPYDQLTRKVFADWLEEHGEDDHAAWHRAWTPEWQQSLEYLTEFAERIDETEDADKPTLDDVVGAGRRALDDDSYSCISGLGFLAEGLMMDREEREKFWHHWSVYTRTEVPEEKRSHEVFSCSC